MSERRQRQIYVVSVVAALLSIPATYTSLRAFEVLFRNEPNPATVIWSGKIALFWRLGIAAYVGGMVTPLVFFVARAHLSHAVRALPTMAIVVALMMAIQGLILP